MTFDYENIWWCLNINEKLENNKKLFAEMRKVAMNIVSDILLRRYLS